jgi:hypothetical protein
MTAEEQEKREWLAYVGKSIIDHIFLSITNSVWFSWGVKHPTLTYYHDMPSVAMVVNGALHKGWVITSLNEGSDLYEIYLIAKDNKTVVKKVEGIYNDELIERPAGLTNDEYFAMLRDLNEPCTI